MNLSTAIRKGAAQRPQCRRAYFGLTDDGQVGSCAIGAAVEGLVGYVGPAREDLPYDVDRLLDRLAYAIVPLGGAVACPGCEQLIGGLISTIVHLNDTDGWPRERIAEWVETLEDQA